MKKLCVVMLLVCLILTTACGKLKSKNNNIRLQGSTEAVLYTVKAPVGGEIRGLILDTGEAKASLCSGWERRMKTRKWKKPPQSWPKPRPG